MAKPWLLNNGPNPSEGPGDRADEAAEEGEEKGKGREGGEGKERVAHNTPNPLAEPPAGIERSLQPEKGEGNPQRSPRGRKRAEEGTESSPKERGGNPPSRRARPLCAA